VRFAERDLDELMSVLVKPAARSLIVAPRLPAMPKGHPFAGQDDVVLDCDVPGCGWHAMGPGTLMDEARKAHYREYHASAQVAGVFRINHPR
jgi:hypothetical protein